MELIKYYNFLVGSSHYIETLSDQQVLIAIFPKVFFLHYCNTSNFFLSKIDEVSFEFKSQYV